MWPPKSDLLGGFSGYTGRYHGLHLDLRRVTISRLRVFRHGGSAKSIYSGALPPPIAVASFEPSRPLSRNRLVGMKLCCHTKPETPSTRGGADELLCLSTQQCCNLTRLLWPGENNRVHITSSVISVIPKEKKYTNGRTYLCTNTYVRVQS